MRLEDGIHEVVAHYRDTHLSLATQTSRPASVAASMQGHYISGEARPIEEYCGNP